MDNRPIGIYDSGIGGLTGLKALHRLLPGETLIFFGDTGRMPYGPRSGEELCRIARQDMEFLASFGVKAILAACGTISSAAGSELARFPVPAFGVVTPALEAMARTEGDGPLGIIATEASIRSGQFTDALRRRCPEREVIGLSCPEFAPVIEAGHIDPGDPQLRASVQRSLAPIRGIGFSALLLACTHYGIIADSIRSELGGVPLLSASECAAAALRDHLVQNGMTGSGGGARFFVSAEPEPFEAFAEKYLEMGPVHAQRVPVMKL